MPTEKTPLDRMRLDKWLWAARFFKTRSLATQAIEHGRVKLNDDRVKPAREVKPGDRLELHVGDFDWNSRDVNGAMVLWTGTRGTLGESSYSVQFEGRRTPFSDLSQLLVLPPGEWLLTWRAKAKRLDSPRGLSWRTTFVSAWPVQSPVSLVLQ